MLLILMQGFETYLYPTDVVWIWVNCVGQDTILTILLILQESLGQFKVFAIIKAINMSQYI